MENSVKYNTEVEVWHEPDEEGNIWTVTTWSDGRQVQWVSNAVYEHNGRLEFDLIEDDTTEL